GTARERAKTRHPAGPGTWASFQKAAGPFFMGGPDTKTPMTEAKTSGDLLAAEPVHPLPIRGSFPGEKPPQFAGDVVKIKFRKLIQPLLEHAIQPQKGRGQEDQQPPSRDAPTVLLQVAPRRPPFPRIGGDAEVAAQVFLEFLFEGNRESEGFPIALHPLQNDSPGS